MRLPLLLERGENRSLTPREAARVQSFPDWFRFPVSRTHAYRLIGNAVPPLVAEAVGLAVAEFLARSGAGVLPASVGVSPVFPSAPSQSGVALRLPPQSKTPASFRVHRR